MYIPGKQFHDCGKFLGDRVRLGMIPHGLVMLTAPTSRHQLCANEIDTGVITPF